MVRFTGSLLFFVVVTGLLSGCGDPAPSTPIAPDVPPPDTSKISQSEIDRFHQSEHERGSEHTSGTRSGG